MEPFKNLSDLQKTKLLRLLQVHFYKYKKGQEILTITKQENVICIVNYGLIQIINIDYNGNETILETLGKDSVFGTNINGIDNESCEIIAKEDCEIMVIDYAVLTNIKNTAHVYFNIFINNLFDIINEKYKRTNIKIRVLEKKTIRDRLLEYFDIEYKNSYMRNIYLPFNLKDLADYIAVNRSAMFRELKNLKEENLIEIKGKRITLLYK